MVKSTSVGVGDFKTTAEKAMEEEKKIRKTSANAIAKCRRGFKSKTDCEQVTPLYDASAKCPTCSRGGSL